MAQSRKRMNSQTQVTPEVIQKMFDGLAPRYDLFNRLTSLGQDKRWRRETLKPLRPGMRVLDLGCGTGDLTFEALKKVGTPGEVVGLDFSPNMLAFARERHKKLGLNGSHRIRFILKKAEELPFETNPYDAVVSGFVLRNLYENIDAILAGVYKSLKDGGLISFLDITEPRNRALRALWRFYMNTAVAFYGKALFGGKYPLCYLTQSAKRFPGPAEFVKKLERAGFRQITARSFMLGAITLYQAVKL